jgi:hypothetical protein
VSLCVPAIFSHVCQVQVHLRPLFKQGGSRSLCFLSLLMFVEKKKTKICESRLPETTCIQSNHPAALTTYSFTKSAVFQEHSNEDTRGHSQRTNSIGLSTSTTKICLPNNNFVGLRGPKELAAPTRSIRTKPARRTSSSGGAPGSPHDAASQVCPSCRYPWHH